MDRVIKEIRKMMLRMTEESISKRELDEKKPARAMRIMQEQHK
jgi:hypothetical protein